MQYMIRINNVISVFGRLRRIMSFTSLPNVTYPIPPNRDPKAHTNNVVSIKTKRNFDWSFIPALRFSDVTFPSKFSSAIPKKYGTPRGSINFISLKK